MVDDAFNPIGAAQVVLLAWEPGVPPVDQAVSSPEGAFAFSRLAPGDYRLMGSAPGFANTTLVVKVNPDEVTSAFVILSQLPTDEPHMLLTIRTKMQACAHSVLGQHLNGLGPFHTACRSVVPGGNLSYVAAPMPVGHQAAVVEFDWLDDGVTGIWNVYGRANKTSPLQWYATSAAPDAMVFPVARLQLVSGEHAMRYSDPSGLSGTDPVPASDEAFELLAGVEYGGKAYADDVRAGFELEWRHSIYVSVFVNGRPGHLDDYSAVPDS